MKTPILFLVFNRPELTRKVFQSIRLARPSRLFIVADGARAGRPEEEKACAEVKKIVQAVDWPCEVLTNYSERNLGCKIRVSSGIDWGFRNSEELIILEDDCLPSQSFFDYAEYCLHKYRNDERVGLIAGVNLVPSRYLPTGGHSYRYSKFAHIWGWASWRRVWQTYSVHLSDLPATLLEFKKLYSCSVRDSDYWYQIFERVKNGEINTWDYQLFYTLWKSGQLSVSPNINLVENIGFGIDATHTTEGKPSWILPASEMTQPFTPPKTFTIEDRADLWESKNLFTHPKLSRRLYNAVKRRINKLF